MIVSGSITTMGRIFLSWNATFAMGSLSISESTAKQKMLSEIVPWMVLRAVEQSIPNSTARNISRAHFELLPVHEQLILLKSSMIIHRIVTARTDTLTRPQCHHHVRTGVLRRAIRAAEELVQSWIQSTG